MSKDISITEWTEHFRWTPAGFELTEGAWDGTMRIRYGKNKGVPYSEVDEIWLFWAANRKPLTDPSPFPDQFAAKEIERRNALWIDGGPPPAPEYEI